MIDLAPYLEFSENLNSADKNDLDLSLKNLCSEVSRTLRDTGALLVKDPRCTAEDNDRFLDMMEMYFEMSDEFKRRQERSHLHYQVCLLSIYVGFRMIESGSFYLRLFLLKFQLGFRFCTFVFIYLFV